jgi:uncharacterized membrane protein YbhN (UPF0104 family)
MNRFNQKHPIIGAIIGLIIGIIVIVLYSRCLSINEGWGDLTCIIYDFPLAWIVLGFIQVFISMAGYDITIADNFVISSLLILIQWILIGAGVGFIAGYKSKKKTK